MKFGFDLVWCKCTSSISVIYTWFTLGLSLVTCLIGERRMRVAKLLNPRFKVIIAKLMYLSIKGFLMFLRLTLKAKENCLY